MSNWFETIVPDDRTWSTINPTKEKLSSKDALNVVEYLNSVLSDPMNPKFDHDNFTAIVNIKNGMIPINGDYTGFSIEIQGEINGEQVNKTVLHTDNPADEVWMWTVKSISFIKDGAGIGESNPVTIDAGDDYVMRIQVKGSAEEPGEQPYDKRGPYWAANAEFNPKITQASLTSIKAALNRALGMENL